MKSTAAGAKTLGHLCFPMSYVAQLRMDEVASAHGQRQGLLPCKSHLVQCVLMCSTEYVE
jgi:hypothetical protein